MRRPGPAFWGSLSGGGETYATCGTGTSQSPINLDTRTAVRTQLGDIRSALLNYMLWLSAEINKLDLESSYITMDLQIRLLCSKTYVFKKGKDQMFKFSFCYF